MKASTNFKNKDVLLVRFRDRLDIVSIIVTLCALLEDTKKEPGKIFYIDKPNKGRCFTKKELKDGIEELNRRSLYDREYKYSTRSRLTPNAIKLVENMAKKLSNIPLRFPPVLPRKRGGEWTTIGMIQTDIQEQ